MNQVSGGAVRYLHAARLMNTGDAHHDLSELDNRLRSLFTPHCSRSPKRSRPCGYFPEGRVNKGRRSEIEERSTEFLQFRTEVGPPVRGRALPGSGHQAD